MDEYVILNIYIKRRRKFAIANQFQRKEISYIDLHFFSFSLFLFMDYLGYNIGICIGIMRKSIQIERSWMHIQTDKL